MLIKNALAYSKEGFAKRDIAIKTERITDSPCCDDEVINAEGLLALPGLVDIHIHGAAGRDFCEGEESAIAKMAGFLAQRGVLAFCGATMCYDEDTLAKIMSAAASHKNGAGSDLVGVNMEGPFISLEKAGAQNKSYICSPDVDIFNRLNKAANGMIKLVDIAPETADAIQFTKAVSEKTRVSLAHTNCDFDTAKAFFEAGGNHVTHLFNAMSGIDHRSPGAVIAALESDCMAELIADGVHIHPAMVRFAFNTFGAERMILISDGTMACGLPDGDYTLGGQAVTVNGARCVLTDSPQTLAGSCTDLFGCMKNAVAMGIPLESAVLAASENPAKAIGIDSDYGSLEIGRFANVILADEKLNIVHVIKKGKIII
ncbi:MAG: N-acetylglucosamine-6-phosphate deacetylase [Oscillospiraceae bacterium]|nr:N-acetylglucosamine-6-phosphate deacetylase [Oscillospiraceae bacterium]